MEISVTDIKQSMETINKLRISKESLNSRENEDQLFGTRFQEHLTDKEDPKVDLQGKPNMNTSSESSDHLSLKSLTLSEMKRKLWEREIIENGGLCFYLYSFYVLLIIQN